MAMIFNGQGDRVDPFNQQPNKIRGISDKKINTILQPTDWRLISNEKGNVKIKKGYGVGVTVVFDSRHRSTEITPHRALKKLDYHDGTVITEITKLLSR